MKRSLAASVMLPRPNSDIACGIEASDKDAMAIAIRTRSAGRLRRVGYAIPARDKSDVPCPGILERRAKGNIRSGQQGQRVRAAVENRLVNVESAYLVILRIGETDGDVAAGVGTGADIGNEHRPHCVAFDIRGNDTDIAGRDGSRI
jgi:hypothetical protein